MLLFNGTTGRIALTGVTISSLPITIGFWMASVGTYNGGPQSPIGLYDTAASEQNFITFQQEQFGDGLYSIYNKTGGFGSVLRHPYPTYPFASTPRAYILVCENGQTTSYFNTGTGVVTTWTNFSSDINALLDVISLGSAIQGTGPYNYFEGSIGEFFIDNTAWDATKAGLYLAGGKAEEIVTSTSTLYDVWDLKTFSGGGTYTGLVNGRVLTSSGSGVTQSSVTHPVSRASDTTAPTLSSASAIAASATTANLSVVTDSSDGTLYYVVTISGTAPTGTQVRAGQDNSGTTAAYSGNQSISSTGTKTGTATGLTASTTYYAHYQHRDAASNDSAVVSSSSFTTSAASGNAPVVIINRVSFGRNMAFGIRR